MAVGDGLTLRRIDPRALPTGVMLQVVPPPPQEPQPVEVKVEVPAETLAAMQAQLDALTSIVSTLSTIPPRTEGPAPALPAAPDPVQLEILQRLVSLERLIAAPRVRTVERNASGEITAVHEYVDTQAV